MELILILGMIVATQPIIGLLAIVFGIFVVVMAIGMLGLILELAISISYLVALPFILILPLVVESVRRLYHLISYTWSD